MKKNICHLLLIIVVIFSFSSCLTSGLDELPLYEEADITSVSAVTYRYISDEKSPASGQNVVKDISLTFTSDINTESGYVKISVTAPSNFPESELTNLSKSNLLIAVGISTAARLSPTNGSPALGIPGDWSSPNIYVINAANGKKKNWTIEIVSLKK